MDVLKNTPRPASISFVPSPDKQLVFNRIPRSLILGRIEVMPFLWICTSIFFHLYNGYLFCIATLGVHDVDCVQSWACPWRAAGGPWQHNTSRNCGPAWNNNYAGKNFLRGFYRNNVIITFWMLLGQSNESDRRNDRRRCSEHDFRIHRACKNRGMMNFLLKH